MGKIGRPTKYETHVEPYMDEIHDMARTMSEKQMAYTLGISYSTWKRYKKEFPALLDTLKKGRYALVQELRSALIKRAVGYEYTEITEKYEDDGNKLVEKTVKIKWMPPDVAALNLALKNYDGENWANDPQMLALRRDELRLRQKQAEDKDW